MNSIVLERFIEELSVQEVFSLNFNGTKNRKIEQLRLTGLRSLISNKFSNTCLTLNN